MPDKLNLPPIADALGKTGSIAMLHVLAVSLAGLFTHHSPGRINHRAQTPPELLSSRPRTPAKFERDQNGRPSRRG